MSEWKNRIVGTGMEDPEQLLANPFNPKRHPAAQQEALQGALNELGWIAPITVNRVTNHLIDGHARVGLALRNGEKEVPVQYVELSEAEERLALLTLDPIGQMFANDQEKIDELLREVNTGEEALQELLAGMGEALPEFEPPQDPEPSEGQGNTTCPSCGHVF